MGPRQYCLDVEWLREQFGLAGLELDQKAFMRNQSVLASADNETFFSGIFCSFFFDSQIFTVRSIF